MTLRAWHIFLVCIVWCGTLPRAEGATINRIADVSNCDINKYMQGVNMPSCRIRLSETDYLFEFHVKNNG